MTDLLNVAESNGTEISRKYLAIDSKKSSDELKKRIDEFKTELQTIGTKKETVFILM